MRIAESDAGEEHVFSSIKRTFMVISGNDGDINRRANYETAPASLKSARPLWIMHKVYRSVSNRRADRSVQDGRDAMHLLPHYRKARHDT